MLRGLRSCSSARSMNLLADSPCNVGIIFTGVAISVSPLLVLAAKLGKILRSCKDLFGKISTKKEENRADFSRNLFKLYAVLRKITIFAIGIGEKSGFNDALAYYFALD